MRYLKSLLHIIIWACIILLVVPPIDLVLLVLNDMVVVNYFGAFLCFTAVGAFIGYPYCKWVWLQLDRLGASIIYNRNMRTISGIVGQRAYEGRTTYIPLEKFIDFLAGLAGDEEKHCYRAYRWELDKLEDVHMAFT